MLTARTYLETGHQGTYWLITNVHPAQLWNQHGPDVSVDQTWNTLAVNLKEVLNNNARYLSFEENHRYAYKLVLWKQGEMLYKGTTNLIVENLNRLAQEDLYPVFPTGASSEPTQQSHEAELLLKALRKVWDEHKSNVVKLSQLLSYMVRLRLRYVRFYEVTLSSRIVSIPLPKASPRYKKPGANFSLSTSSSLQMPYTVMLLKLCSSRYGLNEKAMS